MKRQKIAPAPQSEAPTLLLTPFSTHLSFRWTLPLNARDIFLCLGFKTIQILDIILTVISGCSNYVHPSPAQLRWKREIIYCIYSWCDIHKRREKYRQGPFRSYLQLIQKKLFFNFFYQNDIFQAVKNQNIRKIWKLFRLTLISWLRKKVRRKFAVLFQSAAAVDLHRVLKITFYRSLVLCL